MDFTINKLILLYLLSQAQLDLSITQISSIILEKGYIDYFYLQQYLKELESANLVTVTQENHISYYAINPKGKETLTYFITRIPKRIKDELDVYIADHWRQLKSELDIQADYMPINEVEFIVHCKVRENYTTLIDLSINAGSKKQAIELCTNWKENAPDLYAKILNILSE